MGATSAPSPVAAKPTTDAQSAPASPLWRPLSVGILAVAVAVLAFTRHSLGPGAFIAALVAAVLVVLAAVDLERMVIPNRIVLPATAVVLVARAALMPTHFLGYALAAAGAAAAFLIPHAINRSLVGMGDVKLAALLGAGLGVSVLGAVLIAFLALFPVAVVVVLAGGAAARKTALPFGPFLALGGILILIFPGFTAGLGG